MSRIEFSKTRYLNNL